MNINKQALAVKRIDRYERRPTLVFLHDSLGCIELWRNFPERLGELTSCNVLMYDRQGYGKSCGFSSERTKRYLEEEAEILNELLAYWNINQAILFGHSDGGSIALLTAALYPDKILGIITEGAHVFVEEITIQGIKQAIKRYQTSDLKLRLEKYHGANTEALFRAWTETWTSKTFSSWTIASYLPSIRCKALIVQGEEDEFGTLKQVEHIVKHTQKAKSLIIPKVTHTPHKEVPELVLVSVQEFIEELIQ